MAWEGDESHVTVVTVAGPGRTKGILSQDLEHFGRKTIQITDVNYD